MTVRSRSSRFRSSKSRSLRALLLLVGLVVAGCASSGAQTAVDRTGGRRWELFMKGEGRTYARYRVDTDGTLHFGGGTAARDGEFTWFGPLRPDELDRLIVMMDAGTWFDEPQVEPAAARRFELSERRGSKRRTATVGETPDIVAVYDLLETAARRRNEGFLESLPRPGRI